MICPEDYSYSKRYKQTQQLYEYGRKPERLSYDLEHALVDTMLKYFGDIIYVCREIEALRLVEQQKQLLITRYDWSGLEAFRAIDEYSHGTINNDKYAYSLHA